MLGDFLLKEIRNQSTVTYPTLSELLLQLQVSGVASVLPCFLWGCPASLAPVRVAFNTAALGRTKLNCIDVLHDSNIVSQCDTADVHAQNALSRQENGDQLASLLMEQLGGLQYPDDLVTFFSDLSQLMHSDAQAIDEETLKGGADISSAMGFYIRRCCVSFHMLGFEVSLPYCSPVGQGHTLCTVISKSFVTGCLGLQRHKTKLLSAAQLPDFLTWCACTKSMSRQ